MNKHQKELVIKTLRDDFEKSSASFLVGVQGLSVSQSQQLRNELRSKGGKLKIAKVRLVKRALHDMAYSNELAPYLKQQIGVVFAQNESPAVAKVIFEFAKQNKALNIVAGCVDLQVFDKNMVEKVAQLPSREVLLAQLCGTLKAPITSLVYVLNAKLKLNSDQ
jgi:large subunit ribosomal protein L10